jgi:hypothetical protein
MRVLLNCFSFLKPATIITERGSFSECQIALFIADIRHLDYQIKKKKDQTPDYNLLSDHFNIENSLKVF